ncbi:hypothetical protein C9374_011955 [Naegleria lovaniensis]|uniref:F-box domain-containing protein n=1 Tax=Naegleria lovaniensis TaxID=51637 RepID=A0AA88GGJ4_NAELO|nr:uncharacterized protein C9374_011955 [Naegleria lovaniensis]KAG2373666.1 hypothetical protein C9374_011955 [Naegleria lovaniensis]
MAHQQPPSLLSSSGTSSNNHNNNHSNTKITSNIRSSTSNHCIIQNGNGTPTRKDQQKSVITNGGNGHACHDETEEIMTKESVSHLHQQQLGILSELPVEILFDIFEMIELKHVIRFAFLNKKFCALLGRYLISNERFVNKYLNSEPQNRRSDTLNFPYMIRVNNVAVENTTTTASRISSDDLSWLEKIGPHLFEIILASLTSSIQDSQFIDNGEAVRLLNFWNVSFMHLCSSEKSKRLFKSLGLRVNNPLVERIYLSCGPQRMLTNDKITEFLDVPNFLNNLELFPCDRFSHVHIKEIYLNGFIATTPNDLNSLIIGCSKLEKIYISFALIDGNNTFPQLLPLEAPKHLRENLTHLSIRNMPSVYTRLLSVIDIFETFESLKYFEYDEVSGSGGVHPHVKFDHCENVIAKFQKSNLETLIYRPAGSHQRQLAQANERELIIEEIREYFAGEEKIAPLFPKLRNIEVSDYQIERECKYDPISALIYHILPLATQHTENGLSLTRIFAPSDCMTLVTLLNCNNTVSEMKLGGREKKQLVFSFIRSSNAKFSNLQASTIVFSKPFANLSRLILDNLDELENNVLINVAKHCPKLLFLKVIDCSFQRVGTTQKIHELGQLKLQSILIEGCMMVESSHLYSLIIHSNETLESVEIRSSTLVPFQGKIQQNGLVEMKKLTTLLLPNLHEENYNEIMNNLSILCVFSCLTHIDIFGNVGQGFLTLTETNTKLQSVNMLGATLPQEQADQIFHVIAERSISIKNLELKTHLILFAY